MPVDFNFKDKKILVVEDEEINWLLLKDMFEETQAVMQWACVAQEAIDLVESGSKFDLIIMDVKMPFINGYEATKRIKSVDKSVPVIAYTAFALPEEEEKCRNAGCDDYLSKPVGMEEMFEMIKKYLQ